MLAIRGSELIKGFGPFTNSLDEESEMQKLRSGPIAEVFGKDAVFGLQLSEKSLEHIIDAYDFHTREAKSHLNAGAKYLLPNYLVKGQVHLAVSEVLKGVLLQLGYQSETSDSEYGSLEITQEDKDEDAKNYLQNRAIEFTLLFGKNQG